MSEVRLNGYHIMWLFVFFDLPTMTRVDRRNAALFRKSLIKDGFTMMQNSVYTRFCGSKERCEVHIKRVRSAIPPIGLVSIATITDKQFGAIINLRGAIEQKKRPKQLEFEFI